MKRVITTTDLVRGKFPEDLPEELDFEELYKHHDKIAIGYADNEMADPNDMLAYYSADKIKQYGVLGIEVIVK